ncbi:MAG: hypothetical protein ACE5JB_02960 [bacterium]
MKISTTISIMPMKELLYFSFSDLMIQVKYSKDVNSLQYASHRKITIGERVIIEQYLLTNIAVKTEYYQKHPSVLVYLGINSKLVKELNLFHLKNTIKFLKDKEQDVENSVKNLITESMSKYYFEQIGNTILEIRKIAKDPYSEKKMVYYKNKLEELVDAYNIYTNRKVTIEEVLPNELISYFKEVYDE